MGERKECLRFFTKFSDAPIFTTVYLPEFLGPHQERFEKWKIKTSFLQGLPLKAKLISPFRILAPFVFKTFDFSQYDLIITSATGAYNPNVLNKNRKTYLLLSYSSKISLRLCNCSGMEK